MGYYKNPKRMIHSGSNKLEDIDLDLINYFMDCVCSQPGRNFKDIAANLGICVIHDSNTGYMGNGKMPDRDLVANKLMEYAKNNGVEISYDEALRLTDDNMYKVSKMTNIFEHYTTLSPTYAEVKGTIDNYTAIDSKFPIIEELLRRGVPVDINKACGISPEKGISDQKIVQEEGRGIGITLGLIDSPSKELEAMLNSGLGEMINEASEEPDTKIAGRKYLIIWKKNY